MTKLNLGAIAILDALGFKGIWAREDANSVLNRFKSFRRIGLRHRARTMAALWSLTQVFITESGACPTRS